MNRSKSLSIIILFLGLLLSLSVSQTLAVDPYYRPANPVMDFVPQTIMNSDSYYVSVKDWPDGFPSIKECKKCHTNDSNLYPEFYQIWAGDLRTPHHKTREAKMGQCNACHRSVVEPYSVSSPTTSASSVAPTPASCENCHFWDDPVSPTIHGVGEIRTLGPYGSGMHPDKLALGFDPNNLPSRGTHHEIGVSCWFCHPDEWNTNPYDSQAIRVCENCHSASTLHNIQEHMTTNNIYTVKGVPNQTVTTEEKCVACHGDGPTILPVCSCVLTPDDPPIPSVSRGGTLEFQATVTNNTDEVQVFKFATRITKPNGGKYPVTGYLKGPVTVNLGPHGSISRNLTQYIPNTAPMGAYTYRGYVGTPGNIYDECWFSFEVISP